MSTKITKYNDDFKQNIIDMYNAGKPPAEILREYGLSSSTLYGWINGKKTVKIDEEVFSAKDIKALKRQIADLKEQNEILKKALTIFSQK